MADSVANKFQTAVYTIAVDGRPNTTVQFIDLNVDRIVAIFPRTWVDDQGVNRNVYELWYRDSITIENYIPYLFSKTEVDDVYTDFAGWFTALNAQVPAGSFEYYDVLLSINSGTVLPRAVIVGAQNIVRKVKQGLNTQIILMPQRAYDNPTLVVSGLTSFPEYGTEGLGDDLIG